jgi:hypothetical protein
MIAAVIGDIVNAIETLQAGLPGQALAGVGVGVPGFILMDQGIVVGAPNLPAFDNYPVRDEIEKLWRILLTNQFHDILPGSSIGEVYVRTQRELSEVAEKAAALSRPSTKTS